MKAVVLAAGLGTRLRPLTDSWPKPAVPLLGQPLLRYILAVLSRAGVTAVGLNTHHLPAVMAHVAETEAGRCGMRLSLSYEPVIQGTAGGIRGFRRLLEDTDVFVVWNGDALFAPDLLPLLEEHRAHKALATLVLLPMPPGAAFATVDVDAQGQVRRIAGRGPGGANLRPWHFSGVHLLSPRVFLGMTETGPEDINRDVYPRLLQQGALLRGAVVNAPWSDVGTPGRYLEAQQMLLDTEGKDGFGEASPFLRASQEAGVWRAEGARLEGTASGGVFLDVGAVVERGAHLGPNVYVGPGVRIPSGTSLADAALLEGSLLSGQLAHVLLWPGGRLQA